MKPLLLVLSSTLIPCAFALAGGPAIPEPLPGTRYEKLIASSPFAVATVVDEPKPVDEGPPWSANLFLGGVANEYVNGEEVPTIWINSRSDPNAGFRLRAKEM